MNNNFVLSHYSHTKQNIFGSCCWSLPLVTIANNMYFFLFQVSSEPAVDVRVTSREGVRYPAPGIWLSTPNLTLLPNKTITALGNTKILVPLYCTYCTVREMYLNFSSLTFLHTTFLRVKIILYDLWQSLGSPLSNSGHLSSEIKMAILIRPL